MYRLGAVIVVGKARRLGLLALDTGPCCWKEAPLKRTLRIWKAVLPVLAAAVVSLVLTGCGGNDEPAKPDQPKVEKPKTEKPTAEKPKPDHPSEHPTPN